MGEDSRGPNSMLPVATRSVNYCDTAVDPTIYYERTQLRPEERLLYAVLTSWLNERQHPNPAISREAQAWPTLRDDPTYFSFDFVCEYFNLDPMAVREQITKQRTKERVSQHAAQGPRKSSRKVYAGSSRHTISTED